MARTITKTYNKVTNVNQVVNYNWRVDGMDANGNTTTKYYIARVQSTMTPVSEDGEHGAVVESEDLVGTPRSTPFTNQEVYTAIKHTGTGAILAAELLHAYEEAIEETVS